MEAAPYPTRPSAPVVFEDGIGERMAAVGAANEPLEVLKISNELSAVSTFEPALREQALRLAEFRHEAFGRVRSVERLDARTSTVVIVSDRVRGVRLSEMLATAERQGIPLELNAALCLVRQLVAAVAALHEAAPDSCHGLIAPERIVVTPEGRLVVLEYVLGPALEELRFSQERYWRELGVALPHTFGLPRFDLFADVTQMGAVALALVLGRPLAVDEYPAKISDVVDNASTCLESGERQPLPVLLRAWLRSALQLEPRHSFVSAVGAKKDLDIALSHASQETERAALRMFLTRYATAVLADRSTEVPATTVPVAPVPAVSEPVERTSALPVDVGALAADISHDDAVTVSTSPAALAAEPPQGAAAAARRERVATVTEPAVVASAGLAAAKPLAVAPTPATPTPVQLPVSFPPLAESLAPVTPAVAAAPATPASADAWAAALTAQSSVASMSATSPAPEHRFSDELATETAPSAPPAAPVAAVSPTRPLWMNPWAAGAAAALVLATLGFTLWRPSAPTAASTAATLTVGTNPQGVAVLIDGVSKGSTPLNLSLPAGDHVLELVTAGERRRVPLTLAAGGQVTQYFELAPTAAATSTGNLQVRSDPPRALVMVDGQPYGRTPTVVNGLSAGPHQVVLQGDTDRVAEQVVIEAGVTASLVVPMHRTTAAAPTTGSGWLAVTAPAEVQVYENQRLLGTSRMDRIMVPTGRHELELVNETLGVKATRVVDVANGQVAAVRPDWPRGTVALNALPWAEVFVGGERLGETPIGGASLPVGVHEVVFRHPEHGEKRANAIVTAGAPARLSVDMRTK